MIAQGGFRFLHARRYRGGMVWLANPRFMASPLVAATLLLAALPAPAQTIAPGQAAPATPPAAGGPKSLLPDDVAETPPAAGQAERPADLLPGNTGFVAAPPAVPAVLPTTGETKLPEQAKADETDPLALLAGPTGDAGRLGTLTPATGGYAANIFADSNARFVATLLNRIEAPLASRWMQILLQRVLLSVTDAPEGLNPTDWVAARGAALVAMGDATDAHRLISLVAVDQYTPRLYAIAAEAALASADPIAVCPLSPTARAMTDKPVWTLLDAMCLSVLGDDIGASATFDRLRRSHDISGFDIGLAERIGSSTGGGRRGANPEWGEIKGLTAWRMGLSSAAGLQLPDELLNSATLAQRGWYVRLAGAPIARRAAFAAEAAATGAISSAEANRIFAAEAASLARASAGNSPGGQIRTAHVATDRADRIKALRALWSRGKADSTERYGWQVSGAMAAARIAPDAALASDAPAITASLVAAGITANAGRWWQATGSAGSADRALLWGKLVAVTDAVPVDKALFSTWAGDVPRHRADLLAAGLEGLGRGRVGPDIAPLDNDWTRALDAAVTARRTGEAVALAASAMRGSWAEVPADYLRRIARAFTTLGLRNEARLIVAEAANRG